MDDWRSEARTAIGRYGALANEGELACLLALLNTMGPRVILEIGTWTGGSAWAFGQLPTAERIVTIDPSPQPQAKDTLAGLHCEATQLRMSSQLPDTYVAAGQLVKPDLADVLFIDGDHLYESARHDFETYSSLVRPGGLVVLHDTQGYPGVDLVQVPRLWAQIRPAYRTTELVDKPGGPGGTGLVWL